MLITYIILTIMFLTILYALYKIRNIHLMTYTIKDLIENQTSEFTNLFRQIQAYEALQKKLGFKESLPPLRSWAASPDFLLSIAEHALDTKAETIMECSSGASTVILARCMQINKKGHVYSLENEIIFAEKTRKELKKHGLEQWATILHTPLVDIDSQHKWYDIKNVPQLPHIDVLVIDGPPSFICDNARYPAISQLKDNFDNTTVFLDDANRVEEQKIINLWKKEYKLTEFTEHECEKGCISFKI